MIPTLVLFDLEDIEFSWEDPAVDMDSVYRPGIDTPFSHPSLTIFGWRDRPLPTQKKLTMRKTSRIQLQQHQHQSLSVKPSLPDY